MKIFAKDQDTLIEQSICKSYENYFTRNVFHAIFLSKHKANYGKLHSLHNYINIIYFMKCILCTCMYASKCNGTYRIKIKLGIHLRSKSITL